jgi:DNA-binding CsgD family transcriptional regulator
LQRYLGRYILNPLKPSVKFISLTMVKLLIVLIFILSVALTAGGILISSRLRNACKADCFSTLMYGLTFYFTFGFYAIWGQVILVSVFSTLLSREVLQRISIMLILLGTPFFLLSWLMLVKFAREISGRATGNPFIFWFLSGNILLALGIGYAFPVFTTVDSFTLIKFSYVVLSVAYSFAAVLYLGFAGKKKPLFRKVDRERLATGLLLAVLLQNTALVYYGNNYYIALVFIFLFFTTGTWVPVYINYKADLSVLHIKSEQKITFEAFCRNYDISPREQDVIHEVCQGLSNQQIADKLFISLQTVKDHTSRIYYKTNCSSRAQLMTLVKDNT